MSNTQTTESGANLNTSNFGWHSTLSAQLARVAWTQRCDERNADERVTALLDTVAREWRVMVKDVRFALYGGVASDARRVAYTARRIAEARTSIARMWAGSVPSPEYRALDASLEAVEFEIAG